MTPLEQRLKGKDKLTVRFPEGRSLDRRRRRSADKLEDIAVVSSSIDELTGPASGEERQQQNAHEDVQVQPVRKKVTRTRNIEIRPQKITVPLPIVVPGEILFHLSFFL